MKKITLTLITLALFALSCNQTRKQPPIPSTLSEIIEEQDIIAFRDTILWEQQNARIFGEDSIHFFGRDGNILRIEYINPEPGVRWRRVTGAGELIGIGFITNRPLHYNYFDSDLDWRYDWSEMYSYMDSVVIFNRHDGTITVSFEPVPLRDMPFNFYSGRTHYSVYDSTGVLVNRRIFNFFGSRKYWGLP